MDKPGRPLLLENEWVRLEFLPEHGGKIASLFDKAHGHEWLWSNPHLPLRTPGYAESYVEFLDSGGWDEILPSVDPCLLELEGRQVRVPDHGDLVRLPWSVRRDADAVEMSVQGRCLDFEFTRRVELKGPELRCFYRVTNPSGCAFPWLWCAHPLVPFDRELTVETDATFIVSDASGEARSLCGRRVGWQDLPVGSGRWAAKLFSERRKVSGIRLRRGSGPILDFAWDVEEIPYLALWANHGGWSGCGSAPYFNLGVEPAMLPFDSLAEASDPPILEPGQHHEWSIRVHINPR